MSKASRARRRASKEIRTHGMTEFKNLSKKLQERAILEEFTEMLAAIKKGVQIETRLAADFYSTLEWARNPNMMGKTTAKARGELLKCLSLELLAEARYRCRHKSFPSSWGV